MLKIDKLNEQDLQVFKGKKVIIYGFSDIAKNLYEIFEFYQIDVFAFCTDALSKCVQKIYKGIPLISTAELIKKQKTETHLIIQHLYFDKEHIEMLENKIDIEISSIEPGLLLMSFYPKIFFENLPKNRERYIKQWKHDFSKKRNNSIIRFNRQQFNEKVYICLPQKTADYTLYNTFNQVNEDKVVKDGSVYQTIRKNLLNIFKNPENRVFRLLSIFIEPLDKIGKSINYINLGHRPRYFYSILGSKKNTKIKIITAVRDPIAQNISAMYQLFSSGALIFDWVIGDIQDKTNLETENKIKEYYELFVDNATDVQLIFDKFLERYVYTEGEFENKSIIPKSIQHFFCEFQDNVFDIFEYPFDKDKGYSIIKKGNIEIFVYQLEKLNDNILALSNWLGVPFNKFIMGNQATDKWVATSYKEAQNNIKITQEYFDRCYNESYMSNFYSQDDINKFKEKWAKHIRNKGGDV